jgi:hypothetical protein
LKTRLACLKYFFVILIILNAISGFASGIVYPGRACPAIVKVENELEVLYRNDRASPIDSVILKGPYHQERVEVTSVRLGHFIFDHYTGAAVNSKVFIRVPGKAASELYDLVVYSGGEAHRSVKSVKVVRDFSVRHRFIHISDPHVSRQWVGTEEKGYAKELELLDGFVKVANIIAPDFVIVTGDLIHDYTRFNANSVGWEGTTVKEAANRPGVEEKFRNYFEGAGGFSGVQGIHAPVFSTSGNHDFYGLAPGAHREKARQWNDLLGKRVYGFSYGNTRVLAVDDNLGDPETEYPKGKLTNGPQGTVLKAFLKTNGDGAVRIMALHRPEAVDTAFCDEHRISTVLHGHLHTVAEWSVGTTPTRMVRSGAISRSGSVSEWEKVLGFFRIFTVDGDKLEMTPALRFCNNPTADYKDLDLNLTTAFNGVNDGSLSTNQVTVKNRFSVSLPDCRIRFVMKKGENYKVSGGRVEQVIEGNRVTVVDVRFDVEAGKEVTVVCRR